MPRPVPMSQGEACTALMTDMPGGAENSILTFMLLKHQQAARYYNETRHLIQPDLLLVNKKIFNRLPDKLQRLIRESLPELTKREFELFAGWKCSACIRHRQPEWKRFLPLYQQVLRSERALKLRAVLDSFNGRCNRRCNHSCLRLSRSPSNPRTCRTCPRAA